MQWPDSPNLKNGGRRSAPVSSMPILRHGSPNEISDPTMNVSEETMMPDGNNARVGHGTCSIGEVANDLVVLAAQRNVLERDDSGGTKRDGGTRRGEGL